MRRLKVIISRLRSKYPAASCALKHSNPYQLLVATILSAQCTDERVNKVTPVLFGKYPDPEKMAQAELKEIERIIKPTGFYHNKAVSIIESSKKICRDFKGKVPDKMEDLLTLRGVARKTANVVLGTAYGIAEGIVVDTHVKRLAFRMGFTREKEPIKVELDLMKILDKKDWIWFSHAIIKHGREICLARKPLCHKCFLRDICVRQGMEKEGL